MIMAPNSFERAAKSSPIHHSVSQRLEYETSLLIEQGYYSANRIGWGGITPLHLAARGGSEHTVERLLSQGGDVTQADHSGCTALHWAAANTQTAVFELLQAHPGANLATRDGKGFTPLHHLVVNLLKKGCRLSNKYVELISNTNSVGPCFPDETRPSYPLDRCSDEKE